MKLFDPKCRELADAFLDDVKGATENQRDDLAMTIQQAIEDWLEDRDRAADAAHDDHIESMIDERREHGSYTTRKMQEFEADSKRACVARRLK